MKKRLLTLLILPLVALSCFVGCSRDKSVKNIKEYYAAMKSNYVSENSSYLFKTTADGVSDAVHITYAGDLGEFFADTNSTENITDVNLKKRYQAIRDFQQPVIDVIYGYYEKYAANFYENIELVKNKKQSELNTLFKKLENLEKKMAAFAVARRKFETDVNVFGYESAIRSNLTTYSYELNKFIDASFNFVNYFKTLNVKYYSDYVFKANEGTVAEVQMLIDEAYLNLTEIYYYKYCKAFNNGECDLVNLETAAYQLFNTIFRTGSAAGEKVLRELYLATDVTSLQALVDDLIYRTKAFNQKMPIYKRTYANVDYYEYTTIRCGLNHVYSTVDSYFSAMSDLSRANFALLESFERNMVADYFGSLKTLLDGRSQA